MNWTDPDTPTIVDRVGDWLVRTAGNRPMTELYDALVDELRAEFDRDATIRAAFPTAKAFALYRIDAALAAIRTGRLQ